MPTNESRELSALDDALAAIDQQREAVAIIAARNRGRLRPADIEELREILAACDRIQAYVLDARTVASKTYQSRVALEE